ncbi:MAG: membrane protein insertase YidC [Chloroflexi bacterium]|jgi:YidC/Oxa1 family membrane protein insertase|nr:membrane protein insertase YidC [Chloroflexota bacterium]MBT3670963.1 membrane protein insertase YidC [Chloroflexota bacterium]MBT4002143.1 membrane protein insertase YidC [Chloroflexota bacterium]MBT4306323.1 membrane protein insertase YidC [Chloroflexota bacterium]MBT4532796.1 membrane protein insertase YidC [Chloroflexota bacterium]
MDFIIIPFANALFFIYDILGDNFGIAIIVFTILIRLLTFPFTQSQMKSAAAMQELNNDKEWQKVQKKYKDDKEKLAQEQMKVYKEKGINPFGSCLPTLLQFPIIIGLYGAISRVMAATPIELLQLTKDISLPNAASLIPLNSSFLWMSDLSQPERLFLDFLPEFGIPVLAVIVFITSFLQSKLMTPPSNNPNDPSAAMGKSMTMMMPIMIAWISYSLSAGIALYFVTSNVAGILQYGLMGRLKLENLFPKRSA